MKIITASPTLDDVTLLDLKPGDTFRWADPVDMSHDDVCVVLQLRPRYDGVEVMDILNLNDARIFTRDPNGQDALAEIDRVEIS